MSDRERRIGVNEALYRTVNEKIEGLNESFGALTGTMSVVCECGKLDCAQQIEVDLPIYERVRSDAALFIVAPGHELADVEDVVEAHEGFEIVRKHPGEPQRIAEQSDPRA